MADTLTVTRRIIDQAESWVNTFTAQLPEPERVPSDPVQFHWEFPEQSARVVQLAKSVRMVSGIRAALMLADAGMLTECGALLRMVTDFASESLAISEGMFRGDFTTAQKKFVEQFFVPFPDTPESLAKQEREFYVSREDLMKSEMRMAENASLDPEYMRSIRRFLNKGYDSYVHGGYLTAMQLYHGGTKT